MSTYAQIEDVEALHGRPVAVDEAHRVQELLDEAEVALAVSVGDLDARVTAAFTTSVRLKSAVAGMVVRALAKAAETSQDLGETVAASLARQRSPLRVTRRERHLAGVHATAGSVSLADGDESLATPLLPPPTPDDGRLLSSWRP